MKKVILLTGYARSGKDTIADTLYWNYGYEKLKFAQPLYDMAVAMYGGKYTVEDIERLKAEKKNMPGLNCSVRKFLQLIGSEFGRDMIDKDIWTNIAKEKAQEMEKVVISDCRFLNEHQAFKNDPEWETHLWYVDRKECLPQLHHQSERDIQLFRYKPGVKVINNNGTLGDLDAVIAESFASSHSP